MTYPKSLFRLGGPEIINGRHYERVVVNNENEEQVRLMQHWFPLEEPVAEPVASVEPTPKAEKPEPKAPAKPKAKKRSEKAAKKR
jgi:hypothetical protein